MKTPEKRGNTVAHMAPEKRGNTVAHISKTLEKRGNTTAEDRLLIKGSMHQIQRDLNDIKVARPRSRLGKKKIRLDNIASLLAI